MGNVSNHQHHGNLHGNLLMC